MRLTEYSHGAGWACKLSPGELAQVLTQFKNHKATESPNLLVGLNNPDDGGVIQVGDQKIIQTIEDLDKFKNSCRIINEIYNVVVFYSSIGCANNPNRFIKG